MKYVAWMLALFVGMFFTIHARADAGFCRNRDCSGGYRIIFLGSGLEYSPSTVVKSSASSTRFVRSAVSLFAGVDFGLKPKLGLRFKGGATLGQLSNPNSSATIAQNGLWNAYFGSVGVNFTRFTLAVEYHSISMTIRSVLSSGSGSSSDYSGAVLGGSLEYNILAESSLVHASVKGWFLSGAVSGVSVSEVGAGLQIYLPFRAK